LALSIAAVAGAIVAVVVVIVICWGKQSVGHCLVYVRATWQTLERINMPTNCDY